MIKKTHTIIFAFICFFLTLTTILKGQEPYYWQLTDDDGLPSMTVYKTIQDQKGLIWMATANGICSFDGKNIHKYNTTNLNDQEILKIQEGADGNIWGLNLSGQLFYLENNKTIIIDSTNLSNINIIVDFIWFGENLFVINRSVVKEFDNKVADFKSFNIKVLQHFRVYYKNNKEQHFHEFTLKKDFILEKEKTINTYVQLITMEKDDGLVIATNSYHNIQIEIIDKNFKTKKNIKLSYDDENKQLASVRFCGVWNNFLYLNYKNRLRKLDLNSENTIIINEYSSICQNIYSFDNAYFVLNTGILIKAINHQDKVIFKNTSFTHVLKDKEGNLWLSTNGKGVIVVPNLNNLFSDKYNSILKSNEINSINKIDKDLVIIGKKDSSLTILDKNGIKNIPINYSGRVLSIKKSYDGNIYLGGDNGVLTLNKQFKAKPTGLVGAIKTLFVSKNRTNYFGSNLYFGTLKKNSFEKLSYIRTYAIGETPDGLIWIGTAKGVFVYDGKEIKPFENDELKTVRVSAMATDANGSLWITTQGHGVFKINQNKLETIIFRLINNDVKVFNCVYAEGDYVWLGSDQGIFRYNIIDNSNLHIDKYYGLPTNEIISIGIFNENLLVGTSKGLTQIPLSSIVQNTIVPEIHLSSVKVNEIEQSSQLTTFNLSYDMNNILIEYISYQYRARGNVMYQYRIKELDTTWVNTTERQLRLANLAPDNYHIEIRTLNENGILSHKNLALNFYISKPFWQKWWFYLSVLVLTTAGVGIYFRRRHSIRLKMEDLRMQALQAQMNPHFIFNSLNAIQHFLTINDEDNAIRYLSKFARLIRVIFEYNKKTAIKLEEEIAMLQTYLSLEQLRFKDKITVHFDISVELNEKLEEIYLPPLLIQPIIENAFKHGLFHKKTKGNLRVSFELWKDKFLKCVVTDDGIGREAVKSISTWRKKHTSSGIKTTEERLGFWHKKNDTGIEEYFVIEDLMENGIASGTQITLII